MCWTQFKTIGYSLKNVGPSQKTLRPTWCPKLVTGLVNRRSPARVDNVSDKCCDYPVYSTFYRPAGPRS